MLKKFALIATAASALGLAALATTPAAALPFGPGIAPTIESDVVAVQYRRCHLRRSSRYVRCGGYYRPYAPYYGPSYGPYYGGPGPYWGPRPFAPFPFFPFGW
jgi:hypothetical protein